MPGLKLGLSMSGVSGTLYGHDLLTSITKANETGTNTTTINGNSFVYDQQDSSSVMLVRINGTFLAGNIYRVDVDTVNTVGFLKLDNALWEQKLSIDGAFEVECISNASVMEFTRQVIPTNTTWSNITAREVL